MAIVGLIVVPALTPCATTLPVFLTAASSNDRQAFLVLSLLLLGSTLTVSGFEMGPRRRPAW